METHVADPITEIVNRAGAHAAQHIGNVVQRHAAELKKEYAQQHFWGEIDYQPKGIPFEIVGDRVSEAIALFHEDVLKNVTDTDALVDACYEFVQLELYKLMYVQNDRMSAKIARDYFRDFIDEVRTELTPKGLLSTEDDTMLLNMLRYLDHGIQAYEEMGHHLLHISHGDHRGLVSMAQEALPDHKVEDDFGAMFIADEVLSEKARNINQQILAERGIHANADVDLPPHYFLMGALCDNIALERMENRYHGKPHPQDEKYNEELNGEAEALLKNALASLTGPMLIGAIPDVIDGLRETLRKERHLPKDMKMVMADAIAKAEDVARHTPTTDNPLNMVSPHSQWFMDQVGFDTNLRLKGQAGRLLADFRTSLEECESVQDVVHVANAMVMDVPEAVLLRGHEPGLIDVTGEYIDSLADSLEKTLDMTAHNNQEAMNALLRCNLVLQTARHSVQVARQWLYYDTDGGWNHYNARATMMQMGNAGRVADKFTYQDNERVKAYGISLFAEACNERGLTGESLHSPFVPYLYERAVEVAELRLSTESGKKHGMGFTQRVLSERGKQDFQITPYGAPKEEDIRTEAVNILREAVHKLPGAVDREGQTLEPILDSVESVLVVATDLEEQLEQLKQSNQSRGRLH